MFYAGMSSCQPPQASNWCSGSGGSRAFLSSGYRSQNVFSSGPAAVPSYWPNPGHGASRPSAAPQRREARRGPAVPLRPRCRCGPGLGLSGEAGPAASSWEMEKTGGLSSAGGSYPQKNAEILSSQYGINLFLAGLLLTFAWAVHAVGISKSHLLSYLITLMLVQLLWMLWYLCRSCTQRRLIRDKDTHAGARWLKCKYMACRWHRAPGTGRVCVCHHPPPYRTDPLCISIREHPDAGDLCTHNEC